jgi:hypothetical protein
MGRRRRLSRSLAQVARVAAIVSTACFPSLPKRPASLDALGVRLGGEWLEKAPLYEDTRLGSITQIVRRPTTGELVIVGKRAAVFLPPSHGTPRVVRFRERAGDAELLEWPDGRPRYLDRGGGGWQPGALIGADGDCLWRPGTGLGAMDDLAAGDLDGDGVPEFAVGYNGGDGVSLLDATGKGAMAARTDRPASHNRWAHGGARVRWQGSRFPGNARDELPVRYPRYCGPPRRQGLPRVGGVFAPVGPNPAVRV